MTLTTRLMLFFLTALALVLLAFSVTIYALARNHFYHQLEERGSASLDTLVACVETEADGLEWEPHDRKLLLRGEGTTPVWGVYDEVGRRIDGSPESPIPLSEFVLPGQDMEQTLKRVTWEERPWRVVRRTVRHPQTSFAQRTPTEINELLATPKTATVKYQTLVLLTALPVRPIHETLRLLVGGLTGVSVVVWLLAALSGRWLCRRALAPLDQMADKAKEISPADLGERFSVPMPPDQLRTFATAFNDLLARVQEAFERQKHLTADAAHQLGTPLTAMLGQMEVALLRERNPAEYQRVLTVAIEQAQRLRHVIEMLLFLARADAETALPDREEINLGMWLPQHLEAVWHGHPRYQNLQISGAHDVHVCTHPPLFAQALDNLLDNAFKYSPKGSRVEVHVEQTDEGVNIVVADTGQGIARAEQARIFTPFFRTAAARQQGIAGVGLGLAIVARIATALGGRVAVEANAPQGTRSIIQLPSSVMRTGEQIAVS